MAETRLFDVFKKGLWKENPVLVILLGTCPTLAVSNSATNGFAMGAATTFVLLASSAMVSLVSRLVPKEVRIATYIVIIAGFVTLADLYLKAQFPVVAKALGPYVALIVVNCIILGRAEAFASRHALAPSSMDALGMGIGFTGVLVTLGIVREVLGSGSIFGLSLFSEEAFNLWVVMLLPPGAFLTLGTLMGFINYVSALRRKAGR